MAGRGSASNLRRRRWSGSGPDARDPQPLGATLRTWVASAGAGADLKKATLFARWEKIVGPEVADHCSPVSLTDGELVVEAESTAWATQIRMLAPQLLRRINAEVGDRTVVRIRARGPAGAVLEVRLPARPGPRAAGHLRLRALWTAGSPIAGPRYPYFCREVRTDGSNSKNHQQRADHDPEGGA